MTPDSSISTGNPSRDFGILPLRSSVYDKALTAYVIGSSGFIPCRRPRGKIWKSAIRTFLNCNSLGLYLGHQEFSAKYLPNTAAAFTHCAGAFAASVCICGRSVGGTSIRIAASSAFLFCRQHVGKTALGISSVTTAIPFPAQ